MNRIALFISLFMLGTLAGCRSGTSETIEPVATAPPAPVASTTMTTGTTPPSSSFDATGQTLLAKGTFVSNVHTTSGTVSVYEKGGKRTLVFTDFRTDGGPDLRIYLAQNTSLRNFIEVTQLSSTGNFSVVLPAEADPAKQPFVLIWCKAFSVLFGNAELK